MKKRIKKDKDDPVGGKPGEKGLSMKFLNKLERKFGRYAVPNLMLYIIILNAAGLLITIMYPQAQYYLCWSTWTDLANCFIYSCAIHDKPC